MDLDGPTHLLEIPKGLGLADFDIYGTVVINIDVNITIMLVLLLIFMLLMSTLLVYLCYYHVSIIC